MRVCFFGDSFVNGTGDDDALGWVGRVVASARQAGRDVTAYNLGIRRNTSADIAARWKLEASLRLPSECDGRLVFSFGANDAASNNVEGGPRIAYAESLTYAENILDEARRWLPTLMIGPAIIADDREATLRIAELSRGYAGVCARLDVPYLEICHLIAETPVWANEACARDGAHPNGGGYAVLADIVSRWEAWRSWSESVVTASRGR